jgi:recombination protein RecA
MTVKYLGESALRKKYPQSARADILLPSDETIWLPSSCVALNWQTGGGLQYGKVTELFGYESTGKSLLAMDFGRTAQALGGVILWDDAEQSFNPTWAEKNGLDLNRVEVYGSNDIEGFSDWSRDMLLYYRAKLTNNEPILIVCDSIAGLDCAANIDASQADSKAEMGNRAKAIYKMYRLRIETYKRYGAVVLMINQVRKKVGASLWEASETTPGGDATKFFASLRIGLSASKQIKGYKGKSGKFIEDPSKGRKAGRNVYIAIAKNKLAPPKDSVKTQVYFTDVPAGYTGYSKYHFLPEILEQEGIITRKMGRFYYGEKLIAHGEDNFLKALTDQTKMRAFLIKKASINTISQTRDKIKALGKNLYPVSTKKTEETEDES